MVWVLSRSNFREPAGAAGSCRPLRVGLQPARPQHPRQRRHRPRSSTCRAPGARRRTAATRSTARSTSRWRPAGCFFCKAGEASGPASSAAPVTAGSAARMGACQSPLHRRDALLAARCSLGTGSTRARSGKRPSSARTSVGARCLRGLSTQTTDEGEQRMTKDNGGQDG